MLSSKEVKQEQLEYVVALGGFLDLRESDDTYNEYNRNILKAFDTPHI